MNITRKTVLTLLAALLALPTFLIAGVATASAARNPGLPTWTGCATWPRRAAST